MSKFFSSMNKYIEKHFWEKKWKDFCLFWNKGIYSSWNNIFYRELSNKEISKWKLSRFNISYNFKKTLFASSPFHLLSIFIRKLISCLLSSADNNSQARIYGKDYHAFFSQSRLFHFKSHSSNTASHSSFSKLFAHRI